MDGFRNILLIHDDEAGFESALARAVSLAKSNGATLTIAEMIPGPAGGPLARLNPFAPAAPTVDESDYRDRLDGILAGARRRDVDVRPAILRGAPDVEIVRTVLRQGHDLVITAEESRSTLESVLFGKPSSRIMRACPCPV